MTKRAYIWESVDPVSSAWHTNGGLVVVCEDGAFEETIRKHYGDILADPEISSWDPSRLDQGVARISYLAGYKRTPAIIKKQESRGSLLTEDRD